MQGLANYRILLDKFQGNGAFKKDYEAVLGGTEDFGTTFARDYKAWVLGVGKGFKGALDPARYAFFRDRIGPSLDTLYAPREWTGHSPQEQADILKASAGKAGFEDLYKLAIAAWGDRKSNQAIQHLEEALRVSPVDGRALLAVGVLSARVGTKTRPGSSCRSACRWRRERSGPFTRPRNCRSCDPPVARPQRGAGG